MGYDTQALPKNINELLVLSALQGGAKHGYQIALDVEDASGGMFDLQHGTLYPLLHRLERDGLVEGRWTEGGGRRRKEYGLTATGRKHLGTEGRALQAAMQRLVELLGVSDGGLRARPAEG